MNCKNFNDQLYLFQADELTEAERAACQAHLNGCRACAERAESEARMLRVVRSKLTRSPAPPGLETRIRAALRAEDAPVAGGSWLRSPWFAATAAAALLIVVLVPTMIGGLPLAPKGYSVRVHERVTVVDRECDQAGKGIAAQKKCTHLLHLNALKRADGSYWYVSPSQSEFRHLLVDHEARGREIVIEGESYPETGTIRLDTVEASESRRPVSRPFSLPIAAAVSH